MALIEADSPSSPLHRVARLPEPLRFAEWPYVGKGRFDDPEAKATPGPPRGRFRVLYLASSRTCAFVEAVAHFRPDPELIARLQLLGPDPSASGPGLAAIGTIPADWRRLLPAQSRQ